MSCKQGDLLYSKRTPPLPQLLADSWPCPARCIKTAPGMIRKQLDATIAVHPTAAEELVTMRTPS